MTPTTEFDDTGSHTLPVQVIVENPGESTLTLPMHIVGRPTEGDFGNPIITIAGLPPGVPYEEELVIPAGDSVLVEVTAELTEYQPFRVHEVVLSVDLDGQGSYEPVATTGMIASPVPQVVGIPEEPGSGGMAPSGPAILDVATYPRPFGKNAMIDFGLRERMKVVVEVFGVSGRLVRSIFEGELEGGEHRLVWDGRSNSGAPVPSGVYLVRVSGGRDVGRGKAVLLRK